MPINPITGLEEEDPIQQQVMGSIARKYGYPQGLGDEDLVAAQEQARNSRLYAGLGEAFSGLGRSIAGATTPQDTSFYKGMAESADQPVQDIITRRKEIREDQSPVMKYMLAKAKQDADDARLGKILGNKIDTAKIGAQAKAGNADTRINDKKDKDSKMAVERYQKNLNSRTKEVDDALQNGIKLEGLLDQAQTNPSAAAAIPSLMARFSGEKGPLSDFDVKTWAGSQAVYDKIMRSMQRASSGTMTAEDVSNIRGLVTAVNQFQQKRRGELEDQFVSQYSVNYGGDPEENYTKIVGKPKAKPQQSSGSSMNVDQSAVAAELKRRGLK